MLSDHQTSPENLTPQREKKWDNNIWAIESTMLSVSRMPGVGSYNAVTEIINLLRSILKDTPVKTLRKKAFFISEELVNDLRLQGITAEDIDFVENKRVTNRALVRDAAIIILERSNGTISWENLKDMIDSATSTVPVRYLTSKEGRVLQKAYILDLDIDWVLQKLDFDGVTLLIKEAKLSPRHAFDFFDTLSSHDKGKIAPILKHHTLFLLNDLTSLMQAGISYEKAIADLKRIIASEASHYPELHNRQTILDAKLNLEFIDIVPTHELRLSFAAKKLISIISQQPLPAAQSLTYNFIDWLKCKLEHVCPQITPAMPEISGVEAINITLSLLAKSIVNSTDINFENTDQTIENIVNHSNDTIFTVETNKTNYKTILIGEVKKVILEKKLSASTENFTKEALSRTLENRNLLTTALETWVSCYVATQSHPIAKEMCQSLWDNTVDFVTQNASILVRETLLVAEPDFTSRSTTGRYVSTMYRYENESSSNLNLQHLGFIAAGLILTGSAYAAHRFFKRGKTAEKLNEVVIEVSGPDKRTHSKRI
jgi:hypothetical protein